MADRGEDELRALEQIDVDALTPAQIRQVKNPALRRILSDLLVERLGYTPLPPPHHTKHSSHSAHADHLLSTLADREVVARDEPEA